jgi:Uma2 family endonuclease
MPTQPKTPLTIEEYIEIDKNSEERFEYVDGEIFNISGVHPNHSRLELRLARLLGEQIENAAAQYFLPIFV